MTYRVTIDQHDSYLHIIGTGRLTAENARQFLIDSYRAAIERDCGSILVEMRFHGPSLRLGSIYSVIADRSPDGAKLKKIAYVDANPAQKGDAAEFAELAAQNRGVNVRLFGDATEASRWLTE